MKPSELLNKVLAAGAVRKIATPTMTKAADVSFKGASPQARTEALTKLADIAKRIARLEARDRLANTHTLHLPRA